MGRLPGDDGLDGVRGAVFGVILRCDDEPEEHVRHIHGPNCLLRRNKKIISFLNVR